MAESATGYSDFYKNNSSEGASVGDNTSPDSTDTTGDKLRKRALKKRLKLMKLKAS